MRVSHPQRNALARRPSASVPPALSPSRIVPAANGPQLVIGNEQHVTLFAVDVVNLQEFRPLAALARSDVNGAAVAVAGEDAVPRLSPFPRRARSPAVRMCRAAAPLTLEESPAFDADSEHLLRGSRRLGQTMILPRPALPTVPRQYRPRLGRIAPPKHLRRLTRRRRQAGHQVARRLSANQARLLFVKSIGSREVDAQQ